MEERDHKLAMEIFKCQLRGDRLQPHHLAGQFVYTYHLDLDNQLGTPVTAEHMHEHAANFLKSKGFDDYDKRKFFARFGRFNIESKKIGLDGLSTKFYLINPLHKLDA